MTLFEDICLEEPLDEYVDIKEVFADIKQFVSSAFKTAECLLAGGVLMPLLAISSGMSSDNYIADGEVCSLDLTVSVEASDPSIRIRNYSETQARLNSRISDFYGLEDGWDGLSALKPSNETLESASFLVSGLDDDILRSCEIFPSNDSGVYLRGKVNKGSIIVYLNNRSMTYVIKGQRGKLTSCANVDYGTVDLLNKGIELYV